jgi:hypothetical protein
VSLRLFPFRMIVIRWGGCQFHDPICFKHRHLGRFGSYNRTGLTRASLSQLWESLPIRIFPRISSSRGGGSFPSVWRSACKCYYVYCILHIIVWPIRISRTGQNSLSVQIITLNNVGRDWCFRISFSCIKRNWKGITMAYSFCTTSCDIGQSFPWKGIRVNLNIMNDKTLETEPNQNHVCSGIQKVFLCPPIGSDVWYRLSLAFRWNHLLGVSSFPLINVFAPWPPLSLCFSWGGIHARCSLNTRTFSIRSIGYWSVSFEWRYSDDRISRQFHQTQTDWLIPAC